MDSNSSKRTNSSVTQILIVNGIQPVLTDEMFYYLSNLGTVIILVLSVSGCFTNVFNMTVFKTMGFQDSINVSLFGLSFSDFFNSITVVAYGFFFNPWIVDWLQIEQPVIQAAIPLLIYPHLYFINTNIIITAFIALERCLCVAMPLKVKFMFTPTRAKQVVAFAFLFNTILMTFLLCYDFGYKFDPVRNKSFFSITNARDKVDLFSILTFFQIIVNFIGPYIFVTVCTIVLLTNLITKSNWRKDAIKSDAKKSNNSSTRDMKAVKMVVSVLILFIICTIPSLSFKISLMFLGKILRGSGPLFRLVIVLNVVVYLFDQINATFNVLIYLNSSSKYRETFKKIYLSYENPCKAWCVDGTPKDRM